MTLQFPRVYLNLEHIHRLCTRRVRPRSSWMSGGFSADTTPAVTSGRGVVLSWISRTCGSACWSSWRRWNEMRVRSFSSPPCPTSLNWHWGWRTACHLLVCASVSSKKASYICIAPMGFCLLFFSSSFFTRDFFHGISPMGNSGCFPWGKPAVIGSRYPPYKACWVL